MKKEIWKPVKNWENLFEVSNLGRVRSLDRTIKVKDCLGNLEERSFSGRILKGSTFKYSQVCFTFPGRKVERRYVHHLVCDAFLGPRPKDFEVCHNDGNRLNNCLENLRYDTRSANAMDRHKHGTFKVLKGIYAPSSKLTIRQVKYIRKIGDKISARALAKRYGVSHSRILAARKGESYK